MKRKNYIPMSCPICDEYYFSDYIDDLDEENIVDRCSVCGWKYDINQYNNPELKNGENNLSIKEYKDYFAKLRLAKPNYNFLEANKPKRVSHLCPVCGKYKFKNIGSFDICPFCGWEDDNIQEEDPSFSGGANVDSLNDYKKKYLETIKANPNYKWMDKK